MDTKKKKALINWLNFAEEPDQYLLGVRKQADIFLILAVLMFITSVYLYFLTDITHILMSICVWVSGMSAAYAAILLSSIYSLRILHKHISIENIRSELNG
ncbi:hypothetical protein QTP81_16925 [Alteromonas sp. ASW11-36]|uniref:DUF485 domain-containing protein n=1 Tax=Alteromonas arenosi TaxID=3055817 RepID=A0ABT7T1H3_9ALTE|nr:hypothetical protein [Alteromonas sp. ASW11-36]MDM7862293.1 hypothetical protein [Alteromonas sp. ASW11-36]